MKTKANNPKGLLDEAFMVHYLKGKNLQRSVKAATLVRALDVGSLKSYVLYAVPSTLGPVKCELTFKFDPRTSELHFLCRKIQELKGSCQVPPPEVMGLFKPQPLPLKLACKQYSYSTRQAYRVIAKKNQRLLPLSETGPVNSWTVDEREFCRQIQPGQSRLQKSPAFLIKCGKNNPKVALKTILFSSFRTEVGKPVCDMDLAAAGMKLALERNSSFLKYLCGDSKPDLSFASAVASLIARGARDSKDEASCSGQEAFMAARAQEWEELRAKLITAERIVDLDLFTGQPRYLSSIKALGCTALPAWARKSIKPFRVIPRVRDALLKVNTLASGDAALRRELDRVVKTLRETVPQIERKAASVELRDPVLHEAVKLLVDDFAPRFRIDKREARRICHALSRRIHSDHIQADRKAHSKDQTGPAGIRGIPNALVNRIFGMSRSGKVGGRPGSQ